MIRIKKLLEQSTTIEENIIISLIFWSNLQVIPFFSFYGRIGDGPLLQQPVAIPFGSYSSLGSFDIIPQILIVLVSTIYLFIIFGGLLVPYLMRKKPPKVLVLVLILFVGFGSQILLCLSDVAPANVLYGGDRSSAIAVGISNILELKNPYYSKTVWGNPISILPGSFLVAFPFYFIGERIIFMNLVASVVLIFIVTKKYFYLEKPILLPLISFLLLNWIVLKEFLTKSDLFMNSVFLTVLLIGLSKYVMAKKSRKSENTSVYEPKWFYVLPGIFFSLRLMFWILLPCILIYSFRSFDRRFFWKIIISNAVIMALIIVPFFLINPIHFIENAPVGVNADKFNINRLTSENIEQKSYILRQLVVILESILLPGSMRSLQISLSLMTFLIIISVLAKSFFQLSVAITIALGALSLLLMLGSFPDVSYFTFFMIPMVGLLIINDNFNKKPDSECLQQKSSGHL